MPKVVEFCLFYLMIKSIVLKARPEILGILGTLVHFRQLEIFFMVSSGSNRHGFLGTSPQIEMGEQISPILYNGKCSNERPPATAGYRMIFNASI